MRKFLILIPVAVILLSGCTHKNEKLNVQNDSAASLDSSFLNRKLGFMDCNAVVVGEGVRLRTGPDAKAEVIEKLNTGVLVKIIRSGEKKVLMGGTGKCNPDGFVWYEVLESAGKRGWIYGEFIYPMVVKGRNDEDLSENLKKWLDVKCPFGNLNYMTGLARSNYRFFIKPDGDTLCLEYLLPFFWLPDQGTIFPFRFFQNKKNKVRMLDMTKEQNYFRFTMGGMFDDKLTGYKMTENIFQLSMNRELKVDGVEPFGYSLDIKQAEGYFSISPSDLRKNNSLQKPIR
jgi:hypothetical protein